MSTVEIAGLRVERTASGTPVVEDICFDVARGEVLALVGETGAGKTTIGLALLGHARRGMRLAAGSVRIDAADVLRLPRLELLRVRRQQIAYVPQDAAAALNPTLRIRTQLAEALRGGEREALIRRAFQEVALPTDDAFLRRFPHQLSGGEQQRACLAAALVRQPSVVVLDEPTTGLDAPTQAAVLALIRDLCSRHGLAVILITHDLAAVSTVADRTLVLYGGRTAELGATARVLGAAGHPYTRRLLGSTPRLSRAVELVTLPGRAPAQPSAGPCPFAPRCEHRIGRCGVTPQLEELEPGHAVACHRARELDRGMSPRPPEPHGPRPRAGPPVLVLAGVGASLGGVRVLSDVSLEVWARECVALVGASGAGKTMLARCAVGLYDRREGVVELDGVPLASAVRGRLPAQRSAVQYVFQNPYGSLNPKRTVAESVGVPLRRYARLRGRPLRARVERMLEEVTLPRTLADCYPAELSGGERQLVAIARALACEPRVLVCDEVTSSLDFFAQGAIVGVLRRLQRERGLSVLFITHDMALARSLAHRVAVIFAGHIVEEGPAAEVFVRPRHVHTRELIAASATWPTPSSGRRP